MSETKMFIVGNVYFCRSICDYDCIWSYKVIKRTPKTVTIKDERNIKVVTKRVSIDKIDNEETLKPLGSYSMCPILRASKIKK